MFKRKVSSTNPMVTILSLDSEALFQYAMIIAPFALWWALGYYIEIN